MTDTSHLIALIANRSREAMRLQAARSPKEIALRTVWLAQLDNEIANEERFLGMEPAAEMSDADLLAGLGL